MADEKSTPVLVRLPAEMVVQLDDWRRVQPDIPSRPEAVRRLLLSQFMLHEEQDPASTVFKLKEARERGKNAYLADFFDGEKNPYSLNSEEWREFENAYWTAARDPLPNDSERSPKSSIDIAIGAGQAASLSLRIGKLVNPFRPGSGEFDAFNQAFEEEGASSESAIQAAYRAGQAAFHADRFDDVTNPHDPDTEEHQAFAEGHEAEATKGTMREDD